MKKRCFLLERHERLKSRIILPSGKQIGINCDIEANLTSLIALQNDVIKAYMDYKNGDESASEAYYDAYEKLLIKVCGRENYLRIRESYDDDVKECVDCLDDWMGAEFAPALKSASARARTRIWRRWKREREIEVE